MIAEQRHELEPRPVGFLMPTNNGERFVARAVVDNDGLDVYAAGISVREKSAKHLVQVALTVPSERNH